MHMRVLVAVIMFMVMLREGRQRYQQRGKCQRFEWHAFLQ
jgi:hypothetical protein